MKKLLPLPFVFNLGILLLAGYWYVFTGQEIFSGTQLFVLGEMTIASTMLMIPLIPHMW